MLSSPAPPKIWSPSLPPTIVSFPAPEKIRYELSSSASPLKPSVSPARSMLALIVSTPPSTLPSLVVTL